jgi:hypothetical protein
MPGLEDSNGGWPVDLSRYDGLADRYVDYVRVYQGKGGLGLPSGGNSAMPLRPAFMGTSRNGTLFGGIMK